MPLNHFFHDGCFFTSGQFGTRKKSASARLAAYVLRPRNVGGSVLPRKAAVLTEHSYRRR